MKQTLSTLSILLISTFSFLFGGDWTLLNTTDSPLPLSSGALANADDGQVVFFGGYDPAMDRSDQTWVYDANTGNWTEKFPQTAPARRSEHVMASLGDGKVLLFAGFSDQENSFTPVADTWVYDYRKNTWTEMNPDNAPAARFWHDMAYLGEGKVLLFGGQDINGLFGDTWIYDLNANTWTECVTPDAPSARTLLGMSYLGENRVLLFGGWNPKPNNETWIFDLEAHTWTQQQVANAPEGCVSHQMDYLKNNEVIMFGGVANNKVYADAWTYNCESNTWKKIATSAEAVRRIDFSSARLSDGSMIIFGGRSNREFLNDTWLFSATDSPLRTAKTFDHGARD